VRSYHQQGVGTVKRFGAAWMLTLITIFVLTGCQLAMDLPPTETPTPTASDEADRPFSSHTESQDGIITAWQGEASGHQPGQISPFHLHLENQSEVAWQGRYCVYLLSERWQLHEVGRDQFILAPSEILLQDVDVNFPFDLIPGSYGLALIVQRPSGPSVEVNHIDVTLPDETDPGEAAVIPRELVEIARAQCLFDAEAYDDSVAPIGRPAEDVVRLFYWDYLQSVRSTISESYLDPLLAGSYRQISYLATDFVAEIDAQIEKGIGYDPFLCTQELPEGFSIGALTLNEDHVSVRVKLDLGNEFDVMVVDQGDAWRITDVICIETEDTGEPDALKAGTTEEVTFSSGDLLLAGTLTLPTGEGPHPALITITGSGAGNRDNGSAMLTDYRPYRQLANRLQPKGVAVLRYEDRRMVDPTGAGADATAAALSLDAAAALDYLRSRADIDPNRIGVLGHSMGATAVAMLSAEHPDKVAFVVVLAAPALTGAETNQAALAHLPEAIDISEDLAAQMVERESRLRQLVLDGDWEGMEIYLRQIIAEELADLPQEEGSDVDLETLIEQQVEISLQNYQSKRFHFEFTYDPGEAWANVEAPVLALYAEHETAIFAEDHAPRLEAALTEAGNEDVTIEVVAGVNHLFLDAETGNPLAWPTLDQEIPIRVIAAIVDWIDVQVRR
jgi:dienelactone hydrolase